ncbi:hypothetical protein BAE44_0008069 [Dichanthelium oligosanthes]|uniref:AN1-type domain-containing protein n=1 Tax=Dichanthelium oligosanthes TaxID=888268 RepID=A0A1E5W0N9_9POAL|nr:hypothetical protein BAE44_0008069 [Dichanthelium oligosanthes]
MAEKPAAKCGSCAAPLAWAAFGRRILMFETAETRDLCASCTMEYYYRTGGRSTTSTAQATFPLSFAPAAAPQVEKATAPKPKPNRCAACRKKVGLLGFAWRCRGTFCAAHRHADSHRCGFDYRGFARKRIAGENPIVRCGAEGRQDFNGTGG